jgi:hypothetical protein
MNHRYEKGYSGLEGGRKSRNASGFHRIGAKPAGDARSLQNLPSFSALSFEFNSARMQTRSSCLMGNGPNPELVMPF